GRSYVDYGLYAVIGPDNAADLPALAEAGAAAWKLVLRPTTGDLRAPDLGDRADLFQTLRAFGLPVVVRAEDRSVIDVAERRLRPTGRQDYPALLESRPRIGELVALETAVRLAETSGVHVHVAHLALREAMEAVAHHKARGVPLSADACPHYLF